MPTGTVKTKVQLTSDIDSNIPTGGGGNVTNAILNTILNDMVASYEDNIQQMTTAQRDALAGGDLYEARKIYNTDNKRVEIYNNTSWIATSQKPTVAVDCSANLNYPEASIGDQYIVSVAGKIGGGGGKEVYVGDLVYCTAKNAGGTEASVGTSWAVCHSQSATDNPTFYAKISLTSAQVLALNGTPQTIVSAPGAGKIILPLNFVLQYTHVTTSYNAQDMALKYAAAAAAIQAITPALDTFTTDQVVIGVAPASVTANKWYANSALQVWSDSVLTTGDGTFIIGVYYKIHTL